MVAVMIIVVVVAIVTSLREGQRLPMSFSSNELKEQPSKWLKPTPSNLRNTSPSFNQKDEPGLK